MYCSQGPAAYVLGPGFLQSLLTAAEEQPRRALPRNPSLADLGLQLRSRFGHGQRILAHWSDVGRQCVLPAEPSHESTAAVMHCLAQVMSLDFFELLK
jgi:hypothetical protein